MMSKFAEFLNTFFAPFDNAIFEFCAGMHEAAGSVLDPLFKFITVFGDHGLFFIALGLLLAFIPKTRRLGLTMLLALLVGALITNVCLKDLVARARPYVTLEQVKQMWLEIGHGGEADLSFPSGHTTAAFAAATGFFLACSKKKYVWTAFVFAFAIGFSRIYLAVHYPTDVIAGVIVGVLAGFAAYLPGKYLAELLKFDKKKSIANENN